MIEGRRRWRYVISDKDRHGTVRVYLRAPGRPKVRLHETPGTDAFEAEYRAALHGKAKAAAQRKGAVVKGSLDELVIAYYRSAAFRQTAQRTQHVRRLILDRFRQDHGSKAAAALQAKHLIRWRDNRADRPEAANGLLKALRQAYRYGQSIGLVQHNPAAAVPYLGSNNPDGYRAWCEADVRMFEDHHPVGSRARLALGLLIYTAQRRADVVALGKQHMRDGMLTFTQTKNARRKPMRMVLPIVPELRALIQATPASGMTFLENEHGRPYTPESFGNAFRRWCREAGLPAGLSAHGLRKLAAARLAEAGASANEIASVTGHRTLKEVARYTASASQPTMAAAALRKVSVARATGKSVPPGVRSAEWDESEPQTVEQKGPSHGWCPGKDSNLHDLAVTGT